MAEARNGVVINADSAQVYRDLRILSARPTALDESRAPHALYGYVDGAQACSAATWAAEATTEIERAWNLGRLPIVVGGTGLYLRTLLDGIAPVPEIDPAVRADVRGLAVDAARAQLAQLDAPAAARLHANDASRIARALEVVRSTGRSLAEWQDARPGGIGDRVTLTPLILLPDRADLTRRCDARVAEMFDQGAIDEVKALLERADIPADAPVRRAIGVREIQSWLRGEADRATAVESTCLATRQYAKRQYTWFRNQPPEHWPRLDCAENALNAILLRI